MNLQNSKKVWIGLAEVVQHPGRLPLGRRNRGACVNVVACAANEGAFRLAVEKALAEAGFSLVDIEDVEVFSERASRYRVAGELVEFAKTVEQDGLVRFGTFHTYPVGT
jgi:hypothetical protein